MLAAIERRYPEAVKNWDKWDYKIVAPVSLDDVPAITVILKNKNGMFVALELPVEK